MEMDQKSGWSFCESTFKILCDDDSWEAFVEVYRASDLVYRSRFGFVCSFRGVAVAVALSHVRA